LAPFQGWSFLLWDEEEDDDDDDDEDDDDDDGERERTRVWQSENAGNWAQWREAMAILALSSSLCEKITATV